MNVQYTSVVDAGVFEGSGEGAEGATTPEAAGVYRLCIYSVAMFWSP